MIVSSREQTRQLHAINAAVAGIVGFGLGYLYVGRPRLAFLPFITFIVMLFVVGVSRAIVEPTGIYVTYSIILTIWLVSIIHAAIIAIRQKEAPKRAYNRIWIYVAWIIVLSVAVMQIAAHRGALFGFELYRVPSISMAPTVEKGDWIVSDTWHYDDALPAFGDLIVHAVPEDHDLLYIKRIVGLPADRIEISNDVLIRNGQPVHEDYIQLTKPSRAFLTDFAASVIPADHYFVLGDNRHNSRDSRFVGSIHQDFIRGRVMYRWLAYDDGIRWERFPEMLSAEEK
ncbi:MAG: signal peptidase I [Woeseiaceae bacterium]